MRGFNVSNNQVNGSGDNLVEQSRPLLQVEDIREATGGDCGPSRCTGFRVLRGGYAGVLGAIPNWPGCFGTCAEAGQACMAHARRCPAPARPPSIHAGSMSMGHVISFPEGSRRVFAARW